MSFEEYQTSYIKELESKLDKEFTLQLQELREAIFYHLKFHKYSGPDGIPNEILKWGLDFLQLPLLNLLTNCGQNKYILHFGIKYFDTNIF